MDDGQPNHCRSCGAKLARDNTTGRCSACTGVARDQLTGPPTSLPPTFWDDPAIARALAEWHMGKVIAAYRLNPAHRSRIRQADVARWAGITQVRLSHVENGPPIQHLDKLIFWANLLGIPHDRLWFQLPGRPRRAPSPEPMTGPAGPFRLLRVGPHGTDENPDIAAMQAFRSADSELGGGHLYAEVVSYLTSEIGPRLFGGEATTSQPVFTAAAGLTEMAGWMAHDTGNDAQAYRHFHRALDLSKLGGDRQLHVHVLASMSHLALHLDRPRDAIRHAYDGEMALSKAPGNSELTARLWAMQARGFAALDRPREAAKLLDRAARTLTDQGAAVASPWVSRFDHGSLASEAARSWRALGDLDRAQQHAEQIITLRPPERARSRAFAQLTLAALLAQRGEPDHACAIAAEVITTTTSLASFLVVKHLADLQQQLQPYQAVPAVHQFLEHLGEGMRERMWIQQWPPTNPPHARSGRQ
ncbi:helix-turn-helix domain-containing protein [Nocardia alni]|uniref:helix-turn-helix domain-containing protein n=1 Tax=Nocardia alni TaxID=2815723 RepID=UPI001C2417BB|nr:helix-turn-helix transcriptional regulator [Nocardia alni]